MDKKKRSFRVKFAGIVLTTLIFTIISLPIMGIGVFIGYWIWG